MPISASASNFWEMSNLHFIRVLMAHQIYFGTIRGEHRADKFRKDIDIVPFLYDLAPLLAPAADLYNPTKAGHKSSLGADPSHHFKSAKRTGSTALQTALWRLAESRRLVRGLGLLVTAFLSFRRAHNHRLALRPQRSS